MKAKNRRRLYLVGAEYVTVSSGFILGEGIHPKLDPRSQKLQSDHKSVTGFSELCAVCPALMSVWFHLKTDLYQASVTDQLG